MSPSLRRQTGRGQYYLKLSDGCVLRLYPQTVAEFHLYAGRELEAEELEALRQAAGAVSAKMRAVRIVSASAVSARDLERRLQAQGGRRRPTPRLP